MPFDMRRPQACSCGYGLARENARCKWTTTVAGLTLHHPPVATMASSACANASNTWAGSSFYGAVPEKGPTWKWPFRGPFRKPGARPAARLAEKSREPGGKNPSDGRGRPPRDTFGSDSHDQCPAGHAGGGASGYRPGGHRAVLAT